MSALAYVNGTITPLAEARLPLLDRGVFFGDGVYDTLFSINGRLHAPERHFRRLAHSLHETGIGAISIEEIESALAELSGRCEHRDVDFYIQVTRGVQPARAHTWKEEPRPTLIITAQERHDLPAEHYARGVTLFSHTDLRWGRCDIKSVNLLPNVMARQKAAAAGGYDALLVRDGHVTEGSGSSVLIVEEGVLVAPPLSYEILPSITREIVLELAREAGVPVRLERRTLEQYIQADEAMVLSTKVGVLPVRAIDSVELPTERPLIERLRALYQETVQALAE
ncbi:aminotransferase class IV [Candidatus Sumerlaeota bacterium]|nr:aminotransferase class IV [Candidatus Sumerlaeota bacterium]